MSLPEGFVAEPEGFVPEGFEAEGVGFDARIRQPINRDLASIPTGGDMQDTPMSFLDKVLANKVLGGITEFAADVPRNLFNMPGYLVNQASQAVGGPAPVYQLQRGESVIPEILPSAQTLATIPLALGNPGVPPVVNPTQAGLVKAAEDLLRGFATPESLMSLGAIKSPNLGSSVGTLFGLQSVGHLPEASAELGRLSVEGSPEETARAALNTIAQAAIAGHVASGGALGFNEAYQNRPIRPEVLPPLDNRPVAPTSRQIADAPEGFIDLEHVKTAQGDVYQSPIGQEKLLPGPRGEFVGDALGRVIPKEQINPLGPDIRKPGVGSEPYYTVEPKKGFSETPGLIGQEQGTPLTAFPAIEAKLNELARRMQEMQNQIVPAYQAAGEPKQGGMISFRSEAEARGVPNALQQAQNQAPLGMLPPELQVPISGPPSEAGYRTPIPAPDREQAARKAAKKAVEEGLVGPATQYIGDEPLPYAKEGQYPQEGGPTGTFSNLQRQRIQAGKEGVRSNVSNNPPMPQAGGVEQSGLMPYDAASLPAGEKMIGKEGQSSGQAGKGAQIEDANSLQTYNKLVAELQAIPNTLENFNKRIELSRKIESIKNENKGMPPGKKSGSTVEPDEPNGRLYGGIFFLDPKFWSENFGSNSHVQMDAKQMYNRIRNKLNEKSKTWQNMDTEELRKFIFGKEKISAKEVADFVTRQEQQQKELLVQGQEKWWEEVKPQVEVKKFGVGASTPEQKRLAEVEHKLDTTYANWRVDLRNYKANKETQPRTQMEKLMDEYFDLEASIAKDKNRPMQGSHWQTIAPKSEKDMPGYVELAVVKPLKEDKWRQKERDAGVESSRGAQFPSSHKFPPNTLGFVRGYMEGDTFHVIEVQSDWAQQVREYSKPGNVSSRLLESGAMDEPLIKEYERLALKSAIEHARSVGAKRIAIQDAESAMLMEGHDRQVQTYIAPTKKNIELAKKYNTPESKKVLASLEKGQPYESGSLDPFDYQEQHKKAHDAESAGFDLIKAPSQEKGMRHHYDRLMPQLMEELTGEKGERVSFGEHKMAFNQLDRVGRMHAFNTESEALTFAQQNPGSEIKPTKVGGSERVHHWTVITPNEVRKDLIFKNPDGSPKTDVSGVVYTIPEKVSDLRNQVNEVWNEAINEKHPQLNLPKVPDNHVRVWRGEGPPIKDFGKMDTDGQWYSPSYSYASTYGPVTKYIDVPIEEVRKQQAESYSEGGASLEPVFIASKEQQIKAKNVNKGLGGGMQSAVEKNKEAGSILNPFRKKERPLDRKEFLDIQTLGNHDQLVRDLTTPQGISKTPFVGKAFGLLFDPRSYKNTPAEKEVLANGIMKSMVDNFGGLWMERLKDVKRGFEKDENQQITLANGRKDYAGDVIEAELRNPGSQPLTSSQRDFVNAWKDFRQMLVDYATKNKTRHFVDEDGNVIPLSENYFPRHAVGKVGIEAKAKAIVKSVIGKKPGFMKGRAFETERLGVEKGKIKYEQDVIANVGRWAISVLKAVADQRLADSPALQGRKGTPRFLEEGTVNQPAFFGRVFPKDIADKLNSHFNQGTSRAFEAANRVNNELKGVQYTLDASAPLNQGLPLLAINPVRWAKATARHFEAFLNDRVMNRMLKNPETLRIAKLITEGGGSLIKPQDFLAGTGKDHWAGQVMPIRASGRAMTVFLNMAKIELFKAFEPLAKKKGESLKTLVEAVEDAALTGKVEMKGVGHPRALAERLLFNAPSYMRAAIDLSAMAAQGGVSGAIARRALLGLATGLSLIMYGLYKYSGMSPEEIKDRFTPTHPSFMRFPYTMNNGQRKEISLGGIFISTARTLGQVYDKTTTDKKWGQGPDDPVIKWLGNRKSPLRSLSSQIAQGVDYRGEPITKTDAVLKALVPVSLSSLTEDGFNESGTVGTGYEMFGMNTFNESAGAFEKRKLDELAMNQFGQPFVKLDSWERRQVSGEAETEAKKLGQKVTPWQIMNIQTALAERKKTMTDALSQPAKDWLRTNNLSITGYMEKMTEHKKELSLANDEEKKLLQQLMQKHTQERIDMLMESGIEVDQDGLNERLKLAHKRAWREFKEYLDTKK